MADTQEKDIEITIRNGAAKLLSELQKEYGMQQPIEVIALALNLLDRVKDAEVTVQKPDGKIIKLVLPTQSSATRP
jgi:hypothetical protein